MHTPKFGPYAMADFCTSARWDYGCESVRREIKEWKRVERVQRQSREGEQQQQYSKASGVATSQSALAPTQIALPACLTFPSSQSPSLPCSLLLCCTSLHGVLAVSSEAQSCCCRRGTAGLLVQEQERQPLECGLCACCSEQASLRVPSRVYSIV